MVCVSAKGLVSIYIYIQVSAGTLLARRPPTLAHKGARKGESSLSPTTMNERPRGLRQSVG